MLLFLLPFLVQDDLGETIGRFLAAKELAKARVGIHLYDPAQGKTIYRHKDEELFTLASNTKLLTCAAALDRLGPDFEFWTSLSAKVEGDTATLYVTGNGDPNLSGRLFNDDPALLFRRWAKALHARGVRRIVGLVLVRDGFDGETSPPGWKRYPVWHWYAAPYGVFSLNDNCVDLRISPGPMGRPAKVVVVPDTKYVTIRNLTKTVAGRGNPVWGFSRQEGTNIITVKGEISTRAAEVTRWAAVERPDLFFGTVLLETLKGAGLDVGSTRVRMGEEKPEGVALIDTHRSKLAPTLAICLTQSQNFYAEMILRALGHAKARWGSRAKGLAEVRGFLRGIEVTKYEQSDGSGLSRENRASPADLVRVLRAMRRHRHAKVFYQALAVNGAKEGTLRRRMKDADLLGRVHAKTGHIRGVSNLSGYLECRSGKTLVFSILVNGASYAAAHRLQHAICEHLVRKF